MTKVKWQEEELAVVEEEVEETNAGTSRFQSAHGLCNEDTAFSQPVRTNEEFLNLFLPFLWCFQWKLAHKTPKMQ